MPAPDDLIASTEHYQARLRAVRSHILEVDGWDFYLDLLFYHVGSSCARCAAR